MSAEAPKRATMATRSALLAGVAAVALLAIAAAAKPSGIVTADEPESTFYPSTGTRVTDARRLIGAVSFNIATGNAGECTLSWATTTWSLR